MTSGASGRCRRRPPAASRCRSAGRRAPRSRPRCGRSPGSPARPGGEHLRGSSGCGHGHQGICAGRRDATARRGNGSRAAGPDRRRATIKHLVDRYAGRVLLAKEIVTLYESVPEFLVAELDGGWSAAGRCTCCGRTSARSARSRCDPRSASAAGVGHAIVGGARRRRARAGAAPAVRADLREAVLLPARLRRDRRHAGRARRVRGHAALLRRRAWPSSSTWPTSSRTRWATSGCCCIWARDGYMQAGPAAPSLASPPCPRRPPSPAWPW